MRRGVSLNVFPGVKIHVCRDYFPVGHSWDTKLFRMSPEAVKNFAHSASHLTIQRQTKYLHGKKLYYV